MNKILPFFIPFFLFSIYASAQMITVSEPLNIRNDLAYDIIGELKDRILLFRDKESEYEIQAFDDKMNMLWSKELTFEKKKVKVIGLISSKEDFHLIYHYKKKGKLYLKLHHYDSAANLKDSITIKNFGMKLTSPNLKLVISENKKKALLYFFEDQKDFEAYALDLEENTVLWQYRFSPSDWYIYKNFRDVLVNNQGTMYFILEKDNRNAKKKKHRFEIFEYSKQLTTIKKTEIPIEEHLSYDVHFIYDNLNKRLVAAGLYSEDNRARTNGFYYLNIDLNHPESRTLQFNEFEKTFTLKLMDKKKETKVKAASEIDIQKLVLRRDGGVLLIGERNKQYERGSASNSKSYNNPRIGGVVDYYYDNIFVISIHPSGKTHWQKVLHKKQYSQDDGAIYSSFFLLKTPRAIRFLFNDEIRNENTVSEYIVEGDGAFDRNSIFSTEAQEIQLRFRDGFQVAANEILVPSERRNKLRLVKLTY